MSLVPSFAELVQPLSCVMTAPSFATFLTLLTGWVFARRRTVTGMIVAADAVGEKHHSAYHRLFAAARWSLDELGLAVFALVLPLLDGVILLAVDDTLARKRGLKVFGAGMHHDPLLSTRRTALTNWGHCRVVPGVVFRPPFCGGRWFCLPVLFRPYVPKKVAERKRLACHTKPESAVEMLAVLCGRHAGLRFHAVGDSAYGGKGVLLNLPGNCGLTSRLKTDARLYDAPPPRRKSRTGGRPRKRGQRLPTPEAMPGRRAARLTLDIYGRKGRSRVADCVARCYAAPDRPLKGVAVEPLTGGRKPQAFFSTCPGDTAEAVLTRYACRWSMEVTNHDAKGAGPGGRPATGHLGFEEPQGWTRQAVRRTAPVAMLLYSLVVLGFARDGHHHYAPPGRPWHPGKAHASFADMLATLRACCVGSEVLSMPDHDQLAQNLLRTLTHVVKLAA
jgi:hypothetical protein